jgi:hypothetical protein
MALPHAGFYEGIKSRLTCYENNARIQKNKKKLCDNNYLNRSSSGKYMEFLTATGRHETIRR